MTDLLRARARASLGGLVVAAVFASCAAGPSTAVDDGRRDGADWSAFNESHGTVDPQSMRVVPEVPDEITGVPYIHAIRLAWSPSGDVPSYEPRNETLRLPFGALQAVLLVAVSRVPESAAIRVEWFFGESRAFADELGSREDGDHYFALVKRDGKRLVPLPRGSDRADVYDGARLVKTIRFEVSDNAS
jgi:hypothetical protein